MPSRLRKVVKGWKTANALPFDLGLVSDGALRQRFAEAVGWGVFPQVIAQAKLRPRRASIARTLKRDRKRFSATAHQAPIRFYGVEVDGRDHSGEYLFVEVMNVPLLGPRLALSPGSDPGDGAFEVVLIDESQRSLLTDLGAKGTLRNGGARVERGSNIRITASEGLLHRDGKLVRHPPGERTFDISVAPAAISYLRA